MSSTYLQSGDYASFGVPSATSAQVSQASNIIDGYLQRPEGLLWSPDGNGNPCYMTAKSPLYSLTTTQSISPGQNVNVTVTGAIAAVQPGMVAILDRGSPSDTEACIVNSVTGNVVQLVNVQFPHESDIALDFGMIIFEERQLPQARPLTVVSRTPVLVVLGAQGRYGYSRRGNSANAYIAEYSLLAAVTSFGGPPLWEILNQAEIGIDPGTGQLWIPSGLLEAYYTDVRISYIAGYTYNSLPSLVKQACANIINAMTDKPLNGNIKSMRAGDTGIERFAASYLDNDTKDLLNPFRARVWM